MLNRADPCASLGDAATDDRLTRRYSGRRWRALLNGSIAPGDDAKEYRLT
jgi:hypothetical protein